MSVGNGSDSFLVTQPVDKGVGYCSSPMVEGLEATEAFRRGRRIGIVLLHQHLHGEIGRNAHVSDASASAPAPIV